MSAERMAAAEGRLHDATIELDRTLERLRERGELSGATRDQLKQKLDSATWLRTQYGLLKTLEYFNYLISTAIIASSVVIGPSASLLTVPAALSGAMMSRGISGNIAAELKRRKATKRATT